MGGAVGGGFTDAPMGKVDGDGERFGNWTPWAEFNIYIDPESAESIFSDPVLAAKTTIAPLDLTHQMVGLSLCLGLNFSDAMTARDSRDLPGIALWIRQQSRRIRSFSPTRPVQSNPHFLRKDICRCLRPDRRTTSTRSSSSSSSLPA